MKCAIVANNQIVNLILVDGDAQELQKFAEAAGPGHTAEPLTAAQALTAWIGATLPGGYGAGGGGGWVAGQAAYGGGGGGGGGYSAKYYTIPTAFTATPPSFTITVGAGGAAGVNGTGVYPAAQPSAGGPGLVIITAYF